MAINLTLVCRKTRKMSIIFVCLPKEETGVLYTQHTLQEEYVTGDEQGDQDRHCA